MSTAPGGLRRFAPPGRIGVVAGVHAVAITVTLTAWSATRGEARPGQQMRWVVLAAFVAALSGAANAAWLMLSRREVGQRHRVLATRIGAVPSRDGRARSAGPVAPTAAALVAIEGSLLAHRRGCALLEGRRPETIHPVETNGTRARRRPCGWCSP